MTTRLGFAMTRDMPMDTATLDPGFRRDDGKGWIAAFAARTTDVFAM
jgi:hypothetical protein